MATEKKTKGMLEVDAVKDEAMIYRIQDELTNRKGKVYGDIWRVGVNLALRIGDLLSLKFEDFSGDVLTVREQKTKKMRSIPINQAVRKIVDRRRTDHPDHVYLFQSNSNRAKGLTEHKPMNRSGVSRAFKEIGELASVNIHLGTHSMRKTFGYRLHAQKISTEYICKLLNHSSPAVTMRYIGITDEEISSLYVAHEI